MSESIKGFQEEFENSSQSYILYVSYLSKDLHWEKNLTWQWNFPNLCGGCPAQVVMNYGFYVIYLEWSQICQGW